MCMFYTAIWTCGCSENLASPCGEYALRRFDPDFIFEMQECPALWLNGAKVKAMKCSECLIKDFRENREKVKATRYFSIFLCCFNSGAYNPFVDDLANDFAIGARFGKHCMRDWFEHPNRIKTEGRKSR